MGFDGRFVCDSRFCWQFEMVECIKHRGGSFVLGLRSLSVGCCECDHELLSRKNHHIPFVECCSVVGSIRVGANSYIDRA